jgi:hypothetical protein
MNVPWISAISIDERTSSPRSPVIAVSDRATVFPVPKAYPVSVSRSLPRPPAIRSFPNDPVRTSAPSPPNNASRNGPATRWSRPAPPFDTVLFRTVKSPPLTEVSRKSSPPRPISTIFTIEPHGTFPNPNALEPFTSTEPEPQPTTMLSDPFVPRTVSTPSLSVLVKATAGGATRDVHARAAATHNAIVRRIARPFEFEPIVGIAVLRCKRGPEPGGARGPSPPLDLPGPGVQVPRSISRSGAEGNRVHDPVDARPARRRRRPPRRGRSRSPVPCRVSATAGGGP